MQGIPLEDPEGYLSLLPNSPEDSPEGVVNNEVASKVGISHSFEGFKFVSDSLDAFRIPPTMFLSIRQDAHFLQMKSLGEIVVVDNIKVPTGPNVGSGVDDPLFQSKSFRTLTHTIGIFNPSFSPSSGHDIFGVIETSSNQPMTSNA
jgi:hypothetical protein